MANLEKNAALDLPILAAGSSWRHVGGALQVKPTNGRVFMVDLLKMAYQCIYMYMNIYIYISYFTSF